MEWIWVVLRVIGVVRLWKGIKKGVVWLRPSGLKHRKPLVIMLGETAYIASQPYTPDQTIKDIIVQLNLGNPNVSDSESIMTFRLEVNGKPAYTVSDARPSEHGGYYLVPPGGGFSRVPNKEYLRLPVTVPANGALTGWIGFCILERHDLTLAEARKIEGKVVAVKVDGSEIDCRLPTCTLSPAE